MPDAFGTGVHIEVTTELLLGNVRASNNPIGVPLFIVVITLLCGLGIVVQLVTLGLFTFVHVVVISSSRIIVMAWVILAAGIEERVY